MKKILISSVTIVALSIGSAFAADLPNMKAPPYVPPPPLLTWTGFYAGVNTGYAFAGSNSVTTRSYPVFDAVAGGYGTQSALLGNFVAPSNADGFIGGGQIGYNYQFYNNLLVGIEADIEGVASNSGRTAAFSAAPNAVIPGSAAQGATVSRSLDFLGTVRGRIGYLATPSVLVYASAGLAYGGVNANTSILQSFSPPAGAAPTTFAAGTYSGTRFGWTAGAGVEWMFWQNWSAKVEYQYYDLGSVTYNVSPLVNVSAGLNFLGVSSSSTRFDGHIVRAGVNYHFHFGPAPIVATY